MSAFVDEAQLHVKAGDGGAGAVSMRREPFVPRGGPDGGDGAKGGDIWLVADRNVASLLAFRDHPHRRAADGTHGSSGRKNGRGGTDSVVAVPVGTVVKAGAGDVAADLAVEGYRWLARNFLCRRGELDLVFEQTLATGARELVLVEVRARRDGSWMIARIE